ncbi:aminoglycoside 3-N-acetyltransferase [Devosia sp.]|uniref:aminoglycoside 3-N-acetyltransferase n=1 Tax=Devosia sp. TaxID=1871048 RepID=UPI001AC4D9B4|nr:aminoglycoside 3-N-acetyltransferase [Devosia sp.]MBN9309846.1 aminoglycoside 3-N-acetyltransferase [Devosia sp.]
MSGAATRSSLASDLAAIGLAAGDAVLVHAALRRVGPIVGGPDVIVDALVDVLGPDGTILGYCDWQLADEVRDDPAMREHIPAFDPRRSRATRENGFWPELLRTTPGARRSANPGASMAALGGRADWFTADHAMDYGYGPQSPLGKLVEADGKVLMLGAPLDAMTLLHHAEHVADFPNKRIKRYETPILVDGRKVWRWFEEFDTSDPPDGLPDDYFATIVEAFLATGKGRRGTIGAAPSVLVPAPDIVAFGVRWLEQELG